MRTCSRRRWFRRYVFAECTGPFADKSAPTSFGQKLAVDAAPKLHRQAERNPLFAKTVFQSTQFFNSRHLFAPRRLTLMGPK
ncbi:hypothetical protein CXB34_09400 [Pseudomonas amygdali pv. morsprunorum]|nr:hypothetical protein CXB34_09400 [Pseudomonas amygdali pv. morsprunorum]